jgi:hypothetical protein
MTDQVDPQNEISPAQAMETLKSFIDTMIAPSENQGSLSYPNVVSITFHPVKTSEGEVVSSEGTTLPLGFEEGKVYVHNGRTCTWFGYKV